MATEIEMKTERLRQLLDRQGLDGLLLNGQHNFAWITGGGSNGVDTSRENGAATILVTRDGRRLILASRIEMERMLNEQLLADEFEPIQFGWQDERASSSYLIDRAIDISGGTRIASDIPIDPAVKAIDGMISECRVRLTPQEIDRIRILGSDAGRVMRKIFDRIAPRETEIEIAAKLTFEMAVLGIKAIVTLVAADERIAKYRHPMPTGNRWKKTVLLVVCAKRDGLIVSLSRIATVGQTDPELVDRTHAAAFVNSVLWNATREGVKGSEIYHAAARAYKCSGFADEIDKHHQGGAAGYRTREWLAHPHSQEVAHTNMAYAWNPSITGTKVEETVIAGENGVGVITSSAGFPKIEHTIEGSTYFSPGILEI